VDKLLGALRAANVNQAPASHNKRMTVAGRGNRMTMSPSAATADMLQSCEQFAPVGLKLVSSAKAASAKVSQADIKNELVYASNNTAKAIQNMLENRKALKGLKGQLETAEAMEEFKAALSDLDAAIISADTGILKGKKNFKENSLIFKVEEIRIVHFKRLLKLLKHWKDLPLN
jgi:predicted DNA-binding protein (UPF0278 family)